MKFRFIDSAVTPNVLDISALSATTNYNPRIDSYDLKLNNETLEKFGKSGSFAVGDNTFKESKFTVSFYIIAKNDIEYRTRVLQIMNFFKPKNNPFFFEIEYDDLAATKLRTQVQISDFKHSYKSEGTEHRFADLKIELTILDPFWEDSEYTDLLFEDVLPNTTFTIPVSDATLLECYEAFPIFIITSLGFNPNLVLTNQTNNYSIQLTDSNFSTGSIMRVDSETGELRIGTNIKPNIKTGGYFLKLESGDNIILVQSQNSVTINVKFRKRFLI